MWSLFSWILVVSVLESIVKSSINTVSKDEKILPFFNKILIKVLQFFSPPSVREDPLLVPTF